MHSKWSERVKAAAAALKASGGDAPGSAQKAPKPGPEYGPEAIGRRLWRAKRSAAPRSRPAHPRFCLRASGPAADRTHGHPAAGADRVWWEGNEEWFNGKAVEHNAETGDHKIVYDDGDENVHTRRCATHVSCATRLINLNGCNAAALFHL